MILPGSVSDERVWEKIQDEPRGSDGRFLKGHSYNPATQFKKGQHWRKKKEHWDREWLYREYIEKGRSSGEIAAEIGCRNTTIHFWLRKHGIKSRSVTEARALKHWGAEGEK